MCTRFVFNGNDTIVGFNFDIDLSVWTHKVIEEQNRFYIGIKMPDGNYHSFHGVNKNGNVGTLLYVNGNEKGKYYGVDNGNTLLLAFRAYLDETNVGASYYEVIYDRAIVFHKK